MSSCSKENQYFFKISSFPVSYVSLLSFAPKHTFQLPFPQKLAGFECRRSQNLPWTRLFRGGLHLRFECVGCLGSVGTLPLRLIAFDRTVLRAPWVDFNNFWFFGKFRASSTWHAGFLVFLNQTCLFQNQISKISCIFLLYGIETLGH